MKELDLGNLFALNNLFIETQFSLWQILISLSITFIMAMFVYYVYKNTYNGVLYSKNYNLTLVISALAINIIIIGISGNLILSLGLVGALSIVRFRTAIKDPRDTAFMFWVIAIGVVNGVAYYQLSLMGSIFIAVVILILSRSTGLKPNYMMIVRYTDGDTLDDVRSVLSDKSLISHFFVRSDTRKEDHTEKVIEVRFKDDKEEEVLKKMRALTGVVNCTLLASNGEFSE